MTMVTGKQIRKLDALELGRLIKERELGSEEVTEVFLAASREDYDKKTDDPAKINAYISLCEEEARGAAAEAEKRAKNGQMLSQLDGVPVAIKDNMCLTGTQTTAASKMLEGFVPPYTATAVSKLQAAGAVVVGKTNMDEFAMGSSNETSYFGIVRNPHGLTRVPGGSSGGSAAAVAGTLAPYSLGSDTGGSIRQPCSFTGTSGLKPTYGAVSRYGLIAYASSLDQIGPIARDVKSVEAVYNIIAGKDNKDSTSIGRFGLRSAQAGEDAQKGLKHLRIGIPGNYFMEGLSSEVADSIRAAGECFSEGGAEVLEFELPLIDYAVPTYLILSCAEASSNLSRFDGVKYGYRSPEAKDIREEYYRTRSEGFGTEVKRRIMLGSFVLSSGYFDAYYKKAQKVRGLIRAEFVRALERFDMILSPVTPTTAFEIGGQIKDPLAMYLSDIYTVSVNLAGVPALALPCGKDKEGLPIGMQLIGRDFEEDTLFAAGAAYQELTEFHKAFPQEGLQEGGLS